MRFPILELVTSFGSTFIGLTCPNTGRIENNRQVNNPVTENNLFIDPSSEKQIGFLVQPVRHDFWRRFGNPYDRQRCDHPEEAR
jgi:hypothetical protein